MEEEFDGDYCTLTFKSKPHPGCMWGILHILNFHQWHTVKKMLPHRRHSGGRRDEDVLDTGDEAQEPLHPGVDKVLIEEKMSGSSPTKKKSGKVRMRKLFADAMSKHGDHKHRSISRPSRLLRTNSFHHLQPSYRHLPDELRIDGDIPITDLNQDASITSFSTSNLVQMNLPFDNRCEVCHTIGTLKSLGPGQMEELKRLVTESEKAIREPFLKQKALSDMEVLRDAAVCPSKEFLDALEIFTVKKSLFLKFLQDPDYALAHHIHGPWASNGRRGLKRSGTFPLTSLTEGKIMKFKLKAKINGQLQGTLEKTDDIPSTFRTNECAEDSYKKSTQLVSEKFADSILKPDQGSVEVSDTVRKNDLSPGLTNELKKRGHRFRDIRHKIRHAIKESRKERYRILMDSIFHRVPYGRKFSRSAKRWMHRQSKESPIDVDSKDSSKSSTECERAAPNPRQSRNCGMRRTASLNESLDRYAQLFESTYNTEAKNQSTDMPNEEGPIQLNRARNSLGRILSLPDLECFRSLQFEVTPDAFFSGKPTWFLVNSNKDNESLTCKEQDSSGHMRLLHDTAESRNQESSIGLDDSSPFKTDHMRLLHDTECNGIAEVGESETSDHLDETMVECTSISQNEQEIIANNSSSSKLIEASPISVFDFSSQDGAVISPGMFPISEGHCQDQPGFESADVILRSPDTVHLIKVDKKDEADFKYVKGMLKLSGFLGNKYLGTWHSPDQPLDPSLFEEMECLSPNKQDSVSISIEEETSSSSYNHQLLFDTINETLLEVYERSFTYWPRPLSCNSLTRPMPIGHHVLEEVWSNISWNLKSQPGDDLSMDYIVTRDLAKVDGWMNLQFESECVGLELEESIFNDLLDEIIYT